jgi:hypothetical protein
MVINMDEINRVIQVIAEYEGYSIEEAKLSYAARQDLPTSAFCGPDKSYPANDARHVSAGFQKLSQFWSKMPRTVALKIYRCLVRRAKKFGVEHDSAKFKAKIGGKSVEETFAQEDVDIEKYIKYACE